MFSDVLGSLENSTTMVIAAMMIFIACFIAVVVWTMRLDRKLVKDLSQLPLEQEATDTEDMKRYE